MLSSKCIVFIQCELLPAPCDGHAYRRAVQQNQGARDGPCSYAAVQAETSSITVSPQPYSCWSAPAAVMSSGECSTCGKGNVQPVALEADFCIQIKRHPLCVEQRFSL